MRMLVGLGVLTVAVAGGLAWAWKSNVNLPESVVASVDRTIPEGAESFVYSGGCFWCTEADSEKLDGVYDAISGFTAGTTSNPKYYFGAWGDHREAAQVWYDPTKLTYEDLVRHVYSTVDYEDGDGQFCDRGRSYEPAIYYTNEIEKRIAENLAPDTSVVPIEMETEFFPVRAEHQGYHDGSLTTVKYNFYRNSCGRDRRVAQLVDGLKEIKLNHKGYDISHLTPLQEKVTQREGTERAFTHPYYQEKRQGIFVDIVGGQALYSSTDKYSSGSGWPSFHKTIGEIDGSVLIQTPELWSSAIELKSTEAESHLGHIIFDNPHREDKRRHCINGASIRFIPLEDMEKEGYGEWLYLFDAS